MSTSFFSSPSYLFTSESVTEGHPDKLCDQISDAVLDEILRRDNHARVACETAVTTGLVMVMGEITTDAYVEIPDIARATVRGVGYTDADFGFDYKTCAVLTSIKGQSPDIADGVTQSLETRDRQEADGDMAATLGAGDQGMMTGFACRETDSLMPLPITLAHRITRRLAEVRKSGRLDYLRPDGKSQVTVEYRHGEPARLHNVVVSTQHSAAVDSSTIRADVIEHVIRPSVPAELIDGTEYFINPSGRFVVGGPMGDAGLTGRKIIVDTYGGMASHGGGAFSGKDPTKVDRTGAYAARWVAKNLVAAGLAERIELQVAYAIGKAEPVSLGLDTFDTHRVDPERILDLVRQHFDLRPGALIRDLGLLRPLYLRTASYGHFGENAAAMPWENTDRAAALAAAVGAAVPAGVGATG